MASLAVQAYAFLVLVLTGIAWGIYFDLYRVWRGWARPRRLAGDLADLAFGASSVALVALGLFLSNWGELRLYVALGLATGAALYFWLAGPVLRSAARWTLRLAVRVLRRAWRMATWPLRLLMRGARLTGRGGRSAARRGAAAARAAYGGFKRGWAWCRRLLPFIRGLM